MKAESAGSNPEYLTEKGASGLVSGKGKRGSAEAKEEAEQRRIEQQGKSEEVGKC